MHVVQTSSEAAQLSSSTREAGEADLQFFLRSVLGLRRLDEEQIAALQALPLRDLRKLVEGVLLWTDVRGARPAFREQPEVLNWLWPERFGALRKTG